MRRNLKALLADPRITKIFHFARFDIAMLYHAFGVMPQPVYCTKIASRLSRTYTDRHGLKDLVREVLNIDMSKQQQSSDWGSQSLSEAQLAYAASDVLHLHAPARAARCDAGARRPPGAGAVLLRVPADPGQARSAGLGGRGHLRAFVRSAPRRRSASKSNDFGRLRARLAPPPATLHGSGTCFGQTRDECPGCVIRQSGIDWRVILSASEQR